MDRGRYAEVLRRLAASDVEFIVVGLMAGVLRGAPVMTADLDLVHRRTAENVSRLLQGLAVRVIDLETLIELKEQAGRPKDIAVIPVLRATLAETLRRPR